jgi:hypothetical protein
MPAEPITREDIVRVLGALDDVKIVAILALRPTQEELEEAAMWLASEDDVMGKMRRPLSGTVAEIYDIVAPEEEIFEEPPPPR